MTIPTPKRLEEVAKNTIRAQLETWGVDKKKDSILYNQLLSSESAFISLDENPRKILSHIIKSNKDNDVTFIVGNFMEDLSTIHKKYSNIIVSDKVRDEIKKNYPQTPDDYEQKIVGYLTIVGAKAALDELQRNKEEAGRKI